MIKMRLLLELRRLSQIGRGLEIAHFKHIGATFRRGINDFWCVYFGEALLVENVPKQLANTGLDAVNRLIGERPQIDDAVIEFRVLFGA